MKNLMPVIIDDFIDAELVDSLSNFLDRIALPGNANMYHAMGFPSSLDASKAGYTETPIYNRNFPDSDDLVLSSLSSVLVKVRDKVEQVFSIEMDLVNAIYHKMTAGAVNQLHCDNIHIDGTPIQRDGSPEELEWSALLYLSTYGEDFSGGSIIFPNQGLTIFPRKGQLVLFPGNIDYPHEVVTVESGERRNLVFFYARRGNISSKQMFG
jgi:hypothetical protein